MPVASAEAPSTPPTKDSSSDKTEQMQTYSPQLTPPEQGRPPIIPQRKGSNPDVANTAEEFQAMRDRWEQDSRHKTPGGVDPQWFLGFSPKKYGTDSPSPRVSPGSSKKSGKGGVGVALAKAVFEKPASENDGVPRAVSIPGGIIQASVPSLPKDDPVVMPKPVWSEGDFDSAVETGQSKEEGRDSGSKENPIAVFSPPHDPDGVCVSELSACEKQATLSVSVEHDTISERDCGVLASEPWETDNSRQDDGGRAGSQDLQATPIDCIQHSDENEFNQKPHAWTDSRSVSEEGDGDTQDSSVLEIHTNAEIIMLLEDTDMRPCPAELELDGEPEFMDFFGDGWDGSDSDVDTDLDIKGSEEDMIVTAQGSLDSEGYVTADVVAAANEQTDTSENQPCDESSVDFSFISDPTAAETTDGLSRRTSQMPDIPEDATPLPDSDLIGGSGSIFARSSLRAIVMKKWHSSFWVHYGDASLLVFRSKTDFEDWLFNPYHAQRQRDYLVKVRFDFRDEMAKKQSSLRGFRMTDVKLKTYERKGEPMYHFKLEKWTDLGNDIVAAFASPTIEDVEALTNAISICLKSCPHDGCRPIDDLVR